MPNRLINETSPYLLQHAHNPVDWYPWGEEALQKAKEDGLPIFLSIGYSACHWCHVMERESFESPDIARLMNENFINIKVDREERPDLDSIYMQAVQAMTGRGGWPLSVFLTPDGKPLYGGTYFPPQDHSGMPGFPRVLMAIAEAYKTRPEEITQGADQLIARLEQSILTIAGQDPLTPQMLQGAYQNVVSSFDNAQGGFSPAPKFPQPMIPEFLLRYHHRTGESHALHMVEFTLEKMAFGGMYDQIGGGFHRYSTDSQWLVPHFEKMLYDNALLARLYLHAYQVTGKEMYKRIVQETLDYVLRDMTSPEGGFYSSQDADSEGEEGKYFVWTPEEIKGLLGPKDGDLFCLYYGVTPQGNFEGRNILNVSRPLERTAEEEGVEPGKLREVIDRGKGLLLQARYGRVPPGRDEKVLTAWNGMMLRSLAEAAVTLDREDYRQAAVKCASFLLEGLRQDGRVLRTFKDGHARLKGYLEDYACLVDGLISLHEATLFPRWLTEARSLIDDMVDLFWNQGQGIFYDTGRDHESLVVRPRDIFDNATPCGSSVAVDVLLRMGLLTGESNYTGMAATVLRSVASWLTSHPLGFGHWLANLDFYFSTPKEVALVGDRNNPATQALLKVVYSRFLPNKVVAGKEDGYDSALDDWPLLKGRGQVDGKPSAYVCENYACKLPVTEAEALAQQLT